MSVPPDALALQRLAAIGRHAGEVAHDVRNLLGVVLATAEQAMGRSLPADPLHEELRVLHDAARRAATLLQRLLAGDAAPGLLGGDAAPGPLGNDAAPELLGGDAAPGLRDGDAPPAARTLRLAEALARAAPLLRQVLGPGIALVLAPAAAGGLVLADPDELDRVWLNLARNARHAMGAAGTLTLAVTRTVRPDAAGDRRFLCVAVQDTGPGFPAGLRGRLARPFATGGGGVGLGLSSVAGILARAGGMLELAPDTGQDRGRGACLHVLLPERDAPPAESPLPRADAAPPGPDAALGEPGTAAPLALLVEDEPTLARLAWRCLAGAGWQVLAAATAEAGLEQLAAGDVAPDLVVSDLSLPGLDGLALLSRLRQRWPELPAVLTSGYACPAVLPPHTDFLAKPYGLRELLRLASPALPRGGATARP